MDEKPTPSRFRPIIRVFVSSTFSDLVHERNALQDRVWPELEQFCRQRGFTFQAIDLRWGVPSEAGLDHRTMQICFEELRRAQETSPEPNFLILLGNKYGWRPLPEVISVEEFEKLSATAQRIQNEPPDPAARLPVKQIELLKHAVSVLDNWYRRDINSVPTQYLLRARTDRPKGDDQDYTRVPDAEGRLRDTNEWLDVQQTLWAIVNRAYRSSLLGQRFPPRNGDIPASVRFQGSATEQEIWHGALQVDNARDHVVAWFREIDRTAGDPEPSQLEQFIDLRLDQSTDTDAAAALAQLKTQVVQKLAPEPIVRATCCWKKRANGEFTGEVTADHLAPMCEAILSRLQAIILRQINAYWGVDLSAEDATVAVVRGSQRELELELRDHRRFAQERGPVELFVGRDEQVRGIREYLQSTTNCPLVVHGRSGSGKTALLAYVAQRPFLPDADSVGVSPLILTRFIGAHPESSTLRGLMTSLCRELRVHFPVISTETSQDGRQELGPAPLPETLKELIEEFYAQIARATAIRPIYIFLDALDQLEEADRARDVDWLRSQILPLAGDALCHVRIIASCLSPSPEFPLESEACEPFRRLQSRGLLAEAELGALDEPTARQLLRGWLADQQRALTEGQWRWVDEAIHSSSACRHPLYLKVLFEQLRDWSEFKVREPLPASLSLLIQQALTRLCQPNQHGPLSRIALKYLVSARYGLSEGELSEILFRDPEIKAQLKAAENDFGHRLPPGANRYPVAPWARLRTDLRFFLSERASPGATVLYCYHRQVEQAVREIYLMPDAVRRATHAGLAEYFEVGAGFNVRQLVELPFQQTLAGLWDRLAATIGDFRFIDVKCGAGYAFDLQEDYRRADDHFRSQHANPVAANLNTSISLTANWIRECVTSVLDRANIAHFDRGCGPLLSGAGQEGLPDGEQVGHVGFGSRRPSGTGLGEWRRKSEIAATEPFPGFQAFQEFSAANLFVLQKPPTDSARLACNSDTSPWVLEQARSTLRRHGTAWVEALRELDGNSSGWHNSRTIDVPFDFDMISVSVDGRIAVALAQNSFGAWNLDTSVPIFANAIGGTAVRLSANGNLAVVVNGKTLEVWDVPSGNLLRTIDAGADVVHFDITADGRMAVVADSELTELRPPVATEDSNDSLMRTFGQTEYGRTLVELCNLLSEGQQNSNESTRDTKTWYSRVSVWDLELGLRRYDLPCEVAIDGALRLSPCGRLLTAVDSRRDVVIWNVSAGTRIRTIPNAQAGDALEVSADGNLVAWLTVQKSVQLWDTKSWQLVRSFEEGNTVIFREGETTYNYLGVSLSADGSSLTTLRSGRAFGMNIAEVYDAPFSSPGQILTDDACHVICGQRIVTATHSAALWRTAGSIYEGLHGIANYICVWSSTVSPPSKISRHPHGMSIDGVVLAADGGRAVSILNNFVTTVWDVETQSAAVSLPPWSQTRAAALNPTGTFAATSRREESIRQPNNNGPQISVWAVPSQHPIAMTVVGERTPTSVALSPDCRFVVAVAPSFQDQSSLLILDVFQQRGRAVEANPKHNLVAIAADGRTAVTAGLGETVDVYDIWSGKRAASLTGSPGFISFVVFSSDGRSLLAAAGDFVIAWNLRRPHEARTILKHSALVSGIGISLDGRIVLSTDVTGGVCLSAFETGSRIAEYRIGSGVACSSTLGACGRIGIGLVNGDLVYWRLVDPTAQRPTATVYRDWTDYLRCHVNGKKGFEGPDAGYSIICPECGSNETAPLAIISAVKRQMLANAAELQPLPPCLALHESSWNSPDLLVACFSCGTELRLNPFLVDGLEGMDAKMVYSHFQQFDVE